MINSVEIQNEWNIKINTHFKLLNAIWYSFFGVF